VENVYGDSDAGGMNTRPTPEVGESSERQHPLIMSNSYPAYVLLSSKDLGDPELGEVLQWHIERCQICYESATYPVPFGRRGNQCLEYYEIVSDYSEYERDYAQRGNP